MRIDSCRSNEKGTVLFVALIITALFGMFLFSYLYFVRTQKTLVTRSQAWNAAMGVAEAGVEEALAQLNPGAPQNTVDRTANGWGAASGGVYGPVSRSLAGGTYSVLFTDDTLPVIYATGYVSIATIPATLSRAVRVVTATAPFFNTAMAAKENIDFKGNGVYTDSFDSSNPALSTLGRYDPTKASTNGDVASIGGVVNVGNGDVHGEVLLGPTGTDSVSKNGSVAGGVYNDFNVTFEDVVLPQTTWLPVVSSPVTIGGVTYQYAFMVGGDYSAFKPSGNIYVGTNVNVRLLINGTATPSSIRVAGAGATAGSLTIYMNGPTFTLSGANSVDGGSAVNLAYYGTTNNTQVSFTGNASFTGTIYAPEADFKLGGGGSDTYDFVGAVVAKSITVNGHFSFHYDENLMKSGPVYFVARSWQEL